MLAWPGMTWSALERAGGEALDGVGREAGVAAEIADRLGGHPGIGVGDGAGRRVDGVVTRSDAVVHQHAPLDARGLPRELAENRLDVGVVDRRIGQADAPARHIGITLHGRLPLPPGASGIFRRRVQCLDSHVANTCHRGSFDHAVAARVGQAGRRRHRRSGRQGGRHRRRAGRPMTGDRRRRDEQGQRQPDDDQDDEENGESPDADGAEDGAEPAESADDVAPSRKSNTRREARARPAID